MARQRKQNYECPECGGVLKKTIGAQTRRKYWECTVDECDFRRAVVAVSLSSNPW